MVRCLFPSMLCTALFLVHPVSGILPARKSSSEDDEKNAAFGIFKRSPAFTTKGSMTNRLTNLAFAGIVGFATDPLVEAVFNKTHLESDKATDFHQTFLYGAAKSVSVGARAYGVVLLADLVQQFFNIEKYLPSQVDLAVAAPQVGFTVWAGLTLSTIKRTLFKQAVTGNRLGRVGLYDRLIDFVLGVATVANVLHDLHIDIGMGLRSIFAAGGVSALVFSLATKDFASQIVGGFMIQAWDAFDVGETIRLGDGTQGKVAKIGLVETEIVGPDDISIRIPNSQLTGQRVSNISRLNRSQVKQELRFKYSDLDKLPDLLEEIKREIQDNCPKLVTDGSKPFRAVITQYEPDHVQVQVNCHFEINPDTGEFQETRQQVLLCIANAVKKYKVEFAIPSIFYETSADSSKPLIASSTAAS